MYHIQNDKRAKTSAELICRGLQKCLEKKPFKDITISDIQRESTVGRSTFYRLFDNTGDVLTYECDRIFEQLHQSWAEEVPPSAREFICLWMENSVLLQTIVDSGRLDILYAAHQKYLAPCAAHCFSGSVCDPVQMEYLTAVLVGCMAGVLNAWIACGKRENAEQLYDRVNECVHAVGEIF